MTNVIDLPCPPEVSHTNSSTGLQLSWPRLTRQQAWSRLWNPGFAIFATLGIGVGNGSAAYGETPTIGVILIVLGSLGAIIGSWFLAATLANRLRIRVVDSQIFFSEGPFKVKPTRSFDIPTIAQFDVTGTSNKKTGYRLRVWFDDGAAYTIDENSDRDRLLYAEQELERALCIDQIDRPQALNRRPQATTTPQDRPVGVFESSAQLPTPGRDTSSKASESFDLTEGANGTRIVYAWVTSGVSVLYAFVYLIFWGAFSLAFGSVIIGLIAVTAVFSKVILNNLAATFNKTKIVIDATTLVVDHGPIPLNGQKSRTLNRSDIVQLYSRLVSTPNGRSELRALTRDGADVRILSRLTRDEALFLEATIENQIGLVNKFVPGSHEPT